jgi:response regulator RpfG family c-di-GMP phosphodiesterase
MLASNHVDILLVASDDSSKVLSSIAKQFDYSFQHLENIDAIIESVAQPNLLIISEFSNKETSVDELLQLSRQQFPDAFLILIIEKELTKERFAFLGKLGARLVMLKSEINDAKLPFAINQILRANYVPIKTVELVAERIIPFSIFHLMPSRNKFLPLLRANDQISTERLAKFNASSELYIQRADSMSYKRFIEETSDKSAKGLAKRCRANFTALQSEFTNLVFSLSDKSNKISFGEGQELLNRCTSLCDDLLSNLAEFPRAWEIINGSSIGEFGSLERAPSIAAYSGVFALQTDIEKVAEVMLVSLLVDLGMVIMPNTISEKIRNGEKMTTKELEEFKQVPNRSIDIALSRKLSLSEKVRSILLTVYEQADGKGYPNALSDQKLTKESQIIRFAKEFDARTQVKMGELKTPPKEALTQILEDPESKKIFTDGFLISLQDKLNNSDLFSEP